MKRIISLFITITVIIGCLPVYTAADDIYDLPISSNGAYLYNIDTESVVFEKNANVRMYPASLTKMVAALAILTDCSNMSEEVTSPAVSVYQDVYDEGGSNIKLVEGEVLTVEQLLYALILPSACDAATDLAYHFGDGDPQKFYTRMNEVAAEAGATDSNFVNAHGLHNDEHYTTPHDMAAVLEKLLTFDLFKTIINTVSYTIPATNKSEARNIGYTIEMLYSGNDAYYPYMHGVKSGFTNYAGRCLASTAEKDGASYILVLMGANLNEAAEENLAYSDTREIYEYAFSNFEKQDLVEAGKTLTSIKVNGGEVDELGLVCDSSLSAMVDKNDAVNLEFDLPDSIDAPVYSDSVGVVTVKNGEREIATLNLYPATEQVVAAIAQGSSETTDEKISLDALADDRWLDVLVIALVVLFVFIVIFILVARSRHRREMQKKRAKRYSKMKK